jgi:3D (Asp-Asp-Asp) domain-containing protein
MDRARQTALVCFALLIALGNKAGWLYLDLNALAIGDESSADALIEPAPAIVPRLALDVEPLPEEMAPLASDSFDQEIAFPDLPEGMQVNESTLDYMAGEIRVCRITAYHDRGTTASGVQSGIGQCAAPGDVPFGSKVTIPALGRSFIVTDRTHKRFRNNTVDLFIPSREACFEFGVHYLEVIVVPPEQDAWPSRRGFVRAYEG